MRSRTRLGFGLTACVHSVVLLAAVLSGSACSCLPIDYEEVDLATVPTGALESARRKAPGFAFHRAWRVASAHAANADVGFESYLLRGRADWCQSRDIRADVWGSDPVPQTLEPIK
jgi:hypothetical protein